MSPFRFLGLFCLAGALFAPVRAQLVHLSFELEEAAVLFHTSNAGSPWDREVGFITQFDLYYDSESPGYGLIPEKNYWQARIEVPPRGHSFFITRPIDTIFRSENGLQFTFERWEGRFEQFNLYLIFDGTVPTEGPLPVPPFPPLGSTEYIDSSGLSIWGGRTFFPVADVTEAYGGGRIVGYTAEFVPVPEPSTYAIGGLALATLAVLVRRRRCRTALAA